MLAGNAERLNDLVDEYGVDWVKISRIVGKTRNQVYHWYHENFRRRMTQDRILQEDKVKLE